ncbi:hypothetical protein FGO68_gene16697 [Halteria grandinella]|uniref:MORN repeat protein n=1 Tax=Halteria grandinella TaxID=5974 RepID=A0A8J8P2R5_HALGN|nr:hypothetical protein FGO68_gene16697 [Halteria grandinella]
MADSLKETFKQYSKEIPKAAAGIRISDAQKKAQNQDLYIGEFSEDKRHGWGKYVMAKGDRYKGQFQMDLMQGRGVYRFANTASSASGPATFYYIGEFKDNQFHGLGKMTFYDGTLYLGSFNNNAMHSTRAQLKYANGDKYKGAVSNNMKSEVQEGLYTYACGDLYLGQFRGDKKEGQGKLQIAGTTVHYEGDFKDDKKCGHCEIFDLGPQHGKFTGTLNANEELEGKGCRMEFPGKIRYEGEMKENMFHGGGRLVYVDSGNTYEGQFYQHHKDGECTFTIGKTGQVYRGQFEFNYESATGKCDYGKRI